MIDKIKSLLNLTPLVEEGGFYAETYRSEEPIPKDALPHRYDGNRCFLTAIYYLLTPESCSVIHRLQSDEIFHFYLGDPVEMLQLYPDGSGKVVVLGNDILNGMEPQVLVRRGAWQGSRIIAGGKFALLGTTVSPGFDYSDFETGDRKLLLESYPEFRDLIDTLSK